MAAQETLGTVVAVVVAAGKGTRFGAPKHAVPIDGVPMWELSVRVFESLGIPVVVVGDVPGGVPGGRRRRDSVAAGLDTVVFKAGDVRVFRQGSGRHWGDTLRQGSGPAAGSDETTATLTVPDDHVPGEPFEVRIQAAWRAAQVADAPGTFDNEGGVATLPVIIDVLSVSAARTARVRMGLYAAAGWLAAGIGLEMLYLAVPWTIVGWLWAVVAQAALDVPSGWLRWGAVVFWVVGTTAVAIVVRRGWPGESGVEAVSRRESV